MTEADLLVALDALQDGTADPELLAWALVVVDAFYGSYHWAGSRGSYSMAGTRRRAESWSEYVQGDPFRYHHQHRARRSRSGREPVFGTKLDSAWCSSTRRKHFSRSGCRWGSR